MKMPLPLRHKIISSVFFLLAIFLFVAAGISAAQHSKYLVYIGTYTQNGSESKGIYAYRFDSKSHQLTEIGLAAATVNPSFLAVGKDGHFLYAVNELSDYQGQKSGAVSAFAIDRVSGKLALVNQVVSRGADPCYITVDRTGKYVLVANYTGGSVAVFPIRADGGLGDASAFVQHTGHGTNPQRQEGPHAHSIDMSLDNRFAFVDDLGLDETLVYPFDSAKGTLDASAAKIGKATPGAGPRHFVLSRDGKFAYVLDEMGSTVSVYSFDSAAGALTPIQTISSIPKTFTSLDESAEIEVAPSGNFLYASNRGHDSIAVFGINQKTGMLKLVEYTSTKGSSPRSFEIAPGGSLLFAANEKSDNVVLFRIDTETGKLTPTGKVLNISQPVCVKFVGID